jgi:phenylpropionate dioxygenase-like ring-hydroxylating dioxygenase large terminal subunit
MMNRDEAVSLLKRALAHLENRSTDQASEPMLVPVSSYLDAQRWRDELETLVKGRPQPLVLSIEVPRGGDYKAMNVAGVPFLVVRGHDGIARAFLNACRHRGAPLCEVGLGNRRRFRCPYHAWTYDDKGALVAILRQDTFGEVDFDDYGLRELPCEERHGIVWVVLTPGVPIDLDGWLGDFDAELAKLELGQWQVYRRHEFPGPGWKLTYDGYLEGYHFQTLHKLTFGTNTITNLMVHDSFGQHQRVLFGTKALPTLRELPEEQWDPGVAGAPIFTVFPFVSIAGTWQNHAMVSQILPGATIDTNMTVQLILTRHTVSTPAEQEAADAYAEVMLKGTRDEDYSVAFGAQEALSSGANTHLTFGRNEIALQHQHRWIDRLMGRE